MSEHLRIAYRSDSGRILARAFFQYLLSKVIANLGFVAKHFEVRVFEELSVTVTQTLAYVLLHAWIIQFALPRRLTSYQFVDRVADGTPRRAGAAIDRKNVCDHPI